MQVFWELTETPPLTDYLELIVLDRTDTDVHEYAMLTCNFIHVDFEGFSKIC